MPKYENNPTSSEAEAEAEAVGKYNSDTGPAQAGEFGWADEKLISVLESLLFAAGEPVTLSQLANALDEVPRDRIRKSLNAMAARCADAGRGIVLEEIAGGYQLRTRSEHATYVRRLLSAKPPRLSRPILETLAVIAYRQPVTRPEIEQLRGVDSGAVLDSLLERNLIKVAGRKEAPGRPIMYVTTSEFLELFSLKSLEELPNLEEFREMENFRPPGQVEEQLSTQRIWSDLGSVAKQEHGSATDSPSAESTFSGNEGETSSIVNPSASGNRT
jgi:segregation and condensation protein B